MPWQSGSPWLTGGDVWGPSVDATDAEIPLLGGLLPVAPDRQAIEPATFLIEWLDASNVWDPTRVNNSKPLFGPYEERRRVGFDRRDIILCRGDYNSNDPVSLAYEYENETETVVFSVWTRLGRDHSQLLVDELRRCLMLVRRDTMGLVTGQGRNWLKVIDVTKAEYTSKRYWYREVRVDVLHRFRPILTDRTEDQ